MAQVLFLSELIGKTAGVIIWFFQPWSVWGSLLFFGADPFVLYHLLSPSGQWLCRVVTHFRTEKNEVWLTIDDGPDATDTPQILDLLDQHGARATFFIVGERVARWPHLVSEIVNRGHEIAHHTHTHPVASFWCASRQRLARELDDTLSVLRSLNVRPRYFRPPVGIKNLLLAGALRARRLDCVGWTIRSGDCLGRTAESVVASVMRRIRPGAIILMHEGASVPAAMRVTTIAQVLEELSARQIRCVIPLQDQLCPVVASPKPTFTASPARAVEPVAVAD
jgi:peptidoglycan/xylan/chitin deacetylase (PgdA/CDA1 family)